MEPRTIVGMASEHSEGTLARQHHQSPRPTPVSHDAVCVPLCLVCLAPDCSEICGGISVEGNSTLAKVVLEPCSLSNNIGFRGRTTSLP